MISFRNVNVRTADGHSLVESATGAFRPGSMNAVIGPSGCGKTTLIKGILGLAPGDGEIFLGGRLLHDRHDLVGVAGFAPQFSIAHAKLTVAECLSYSLDLLVRDKSVKEARCASILRLVGLDAHREKLVGNLSGGQLRRLGLALEMSTDPECLFCDEVTSGLDPQSEAQILELLSRLCREQGKTVVCVIHNLARLNLFEQVTVLYRGHVVFEGSPENLLKHFAVETTESLYDRLDQEPLEHWLRPGSGDADRADPTAAAQLGDFPARPQAAAPSAIAQFGHLLRRRFHLFLRDRGSLGLTLGITLGFPILVVIFAAGGLPQIETLALDGGSSLIETMRDRVELQVETSRTGGLVSGLVMFQVILLTLIGSNNGAREIAGERQIYEKERLSGLHPEAYMAGKAAFVTLIAVAQGAWMAGFVKLVCGFPGGWGGQFLVLIGATVAMSLISLGFSAVLRSSERASLLSVYLVGFQLPLSGVVLALPDAIVWVVRPFITAYWSWAGYLTTMKETRFYDAVIQFSDTWMAPTGLAMLVMVLQASVGLFMVFWGCHRRQWS